MGQCLLSLVSSPQLVPKRVYVDRERLTLAISVVFLVLPVTVLFAIYPGVAFLKFTI